MNKLHWLNKSVKLFLNKLQYETENIEDDISTFLMRMPQNLSVADDNPWVVFKFINIYSFEIKSSHRKPYCFGKPYSFKQS